MMLRSRMLFATCIACTLAAGIALAQGGPGRRGPAPPPAMGPHIGPLEARVLELTDDQRAQLEELRNAFHEATMTTHETLRERQRALDEAWRQNPLDRAAILTLVDEIGTLHQTLARRQTELTIAELGVLTAPQRETLNELQDELRDRRPMPADPRFGGPGRDDPRRPMRGAGMAPR